MEDICDLSKISGKKRVNSRAKGSTFERKISKILNDRFNTEEFCRSPGSGAFATTHKLPKHLKIYGDLITPENFRFIIECKKGYNKENLGSFFRKNSELKAFIKQANRDSKHANKPFLLILQQDRQDILVLFKTKEFGVTGLNPDLEHLIYGEYTICLLKSLLLTDDYWFLG